MANSPIHIASADALEELRRQLDQERNERLSAEERIRQVVADHKRLEIDLIRYRDHFEALVASRTAELMAINEKLLQENRVRRLAERERRTFEDQFREASIMLEAMLDAIPDVIGVQDGNFRILRFNKAGYRFFGKSEDQINGRRCYELIDQGVPCKNCATRQILRTNQPARIEKFIESKQVWMDIRAYPIRDMDGRVFRVVEHWRDVTEIKKSEASLIESEEKYRSLVENANEGIFIFQDDEFKFANRKAKEMARKLGLIQSRKPLLEYIDPADRRADQDYYLRRLNGHDPKPGAISFRLIDPGSEALWIELNTVNIKWKGQPATLNFVRDITQGKTLEKRLQESQRMESLGTLAGGIAHDFNNLLMGIQGNVSLIYLEAEDNLSLSEKLKSIEDCVDSGARLTKQLLGFARGGKYVVKPIELNQLLQRSADMFGRTRKAITIHGHYQQDLWIVLADSSQMEQVLVNLFLNAWQAMQGKGDLYLSSANLFLDEAFVEPYEMPPGRYVRIGVQDTGIGMDEATMRRIFEPFFTTHEPGRGTGLGLASVFGIVKNHNGFITVKSVPSKGSTFEVYLPASDKTPEVEEQAHDTIQLGSETILLVDDEEYIIEVARLMLEGLGYKILKADNGQKALELFAEKIDTIDLVILDMVMPDMDGEAVFARMREVRPDIKVIFASGFYVMDQAPAFMKDSSSAFLQKPFNMKQLSTKIRMVLEGQTE
jgi:PAS domain S-box-containing protein